VEKRKRKEAPAVSMLYNTLNDLKSELTSPSFLFLLLFILCFAHASYISSYDINILTTLQYA
jgi:p-aminobenzoyl-glutamate transporter AbgT